jgi:hypothetical protein
MDSETPPGPGGPALAGAASEIREHWDDLVDDAEATAAEFEDAGWETLVCHPGDVTVTEVERFGIDVLLPDDEYDRLEAWVEDGSFDEFDVYRAETTMVWLLLVAKDESAERAVCCPAYYGASDLETLVDGLEEHGHVPIYVRNLLEEFVTFTPDRPALLLPDPDDESVPDDV